MGRWRSHRKVSLPWEVDKSYIISQHRSTFKTSFQILWEFTLIPYQEHKEITIVVLFVCRRTITHYSLIYRPTYFLVKCPNGNVDRDENPVIKPSQSFMKISCFLVHLKAFWLMPTFQMKSIFTADDSYPLLSIEWSKRVDLIKTRK